MTLNKQKVEVIRVNSERPICRPKRFPRMPIMYLELIENKEKIKQDLINKEYAPPPLDPSQDEIPQIKEDELKEEYSEDENKQTQYKITENTDPLKNSDSEYSEDEPTPDKTDTRKGELHSSDTRPSGAVERSRERSPLEPKARSDRLETPEPTNRKRSDLRKSPSSDSEDEPRRDLREKSKDIDSDFDNYKRNSPEYSDSEEEDDISKKIKKLLKEERSRSRSVESYKSRDYSRSPREGARPSEDKQKTVSVKTRDEDILPVERVDTYQPPTLSELKNKGQYVERKTFRNITAPNLNDQEEEDLKRELLFKFELLKKSYKNASIPEFTIHSDYNTMLKSYNSCLKQVTLDNSVENYKQYLMGGFMLVEFVGSSFLKLDMSGFTQQQMVSMNSYERLLLELGEKSYVPDAKNLPVELRLLFMILMNAGMFIATKMIMKKTGSNLMNLFGGASGIGNQPSGGSSIPQRKRKMNGPDINIDDLPDIKN